MRSLIALRGPLVLGCAAAVFATAGVLTAADHRDAPALMDSSEDGPVDINDVYAFRSPENPANTVLAMTLDPFAGALSPTQLEGGVSYDFEIDQDGDADPDLVYRYRVVNFGSRSLAFVNRLTRDAGGLFRSNGIIGFGYQGEEFALEGGGRTVIGLYEDAFYFDLDGFNRVTEGTGTFDGRDFFAGANIVAIVLEVPSSQLTAGSNLIGVNARTLQGLGVVTRPTQRDRMGRPAINTALTPTGRKDAYNLTRPGRDEPQFEGSFQNTILTLNGGQQQKARDLAEMLLPDLLTFDVTSTAGYEALNGRKLEDDVIDITLTLVTDGMITSDGVDANDRQTRQVFPYFATPFPNGGPPQP